MRKRLPRGPASFAFPLASAPRPTSVALTALTLSAALAAGCSGDAKTPSDPAREGGSGRGEAPPAAVPAGATPASAPGGGASSPAEAPEPHSVEDCKALAKNPPADPAATTAKASDESKSDRLAPMIGFMREHRPGFRCCFDIWADQIPEAKLYVKVAFKLSLDPAGKFKNATVVRAEADPYVPPQVEGCLKDVAATLTYPESASGMDTEYTHRFDFKPRRRR